MSAQLSSSYCTQYNTYHNVYVLEFSPFPSPFLHPYHLFLLIVINSTQSLQSEIVAKEPEVVLLNKAGSRLMSGFHDDSASDIQEKLTYMNDR